MVTRVVKCAWLLHDRSPDTVYPIRTSHDAEIPVWLIPARQMVETVVALVDD